jgi:hypothetical protein
MRQNRESTALAVAAIEEWVVILDCPNDEGNEPKEDGGKSTDTDQDQLPEQ